MATKLHKDDIELLINGLEIKIQSSKRAINSANSDAVKAAHAADITRFEVLKAKLHGQTDLAI